MNEEKRKRNKNNDSIPSYIVDAITSLNAEAFLRSESSPSYPIETFNIPEKLDSSKKNKEKEKEYKIGNYLIKKTLGQGTFGKVKLATYLPTDEKVAIKILEKDRIVEKDDEIRLKREFDMLALFNHPNVILVAEIFESTDRYYSVMEFCEGGELFNYIVKKRKLSEDESAFFYYQLINGLEYIHSLGIVHRDLKPENLLLTKSHILKIIDFGLSNYFKNEQEDLLETPCGSPCYASPEMVAGKKYNGFKIDIWSSGIILFAMLCGYLPFEDKDNDILFEKILECKLSFPKFVSKTAKDLIEKILVTDPEKRIDISEIKKHPFFIKGKNIFESEFKIIKKKNISNNDITNKKDNIEDIIDKEKNRKQCDIKIKIEDKRDKNEKENVLDNDVKDLVLGNNIIGKENKAINIEENEVISDGNKDKKEKIPYKDIFREKSEKKEYDKKLEETNKNNRQIPISNLEQGNINHHLQKENDRNNQNLHRIKNPIISDIIKDKNISGVNSTKNNPKNVIHKKAHFVKHKEINPKNNNDYLGNKLDKNNINYNVRTRSRDYRNNKKEIKTINFHNFKLNYTQKTNIDTSPKIKTTKHNNKNVIRKKINYTNIIKQNFNSKDNLDYKNSNKKGNIYINNINNTIDNEKLPYKMRINFNFKQISHISRKDSKRTKSINKNNMKMNSFETSIKKDKKYLDNLISINSNIKKYEKKLNFGDMDNKNEDKRHKNKIKEINIHYNNKTLDLNEDNNLKRYKDNLVKTETNKEEQKRRNSKLQNISSNNIKNGNIKIIENVNVHQYVRSNNIKQNLRKIINEQKRIEKEDSKINNDNIKKNIEKQKYSRIKRDNINNNTIENINISNILNKNHIQKKTIDASSNKRHKINTDILNNMGCIRTINTYNDNTEYYTKKINNKENNRISSRKRDQIPIDIANHLNRKRIFKDIYMSNNNSSLNTIENVTKTEHKKKIEPKKKNFDLVINENIKPTRKNIIHIKLNSINTKSSRHMNQKMIFNYNKKQSSIISNNSNILNQTNNSNTNNTSIKNPFLNSSNYLDSFNPSVNYNNISSNSQNINYINRRYKNSQTITYNAKRKKPYVTIRNTVINFNMIDTGIFLSSLNKKDSKKANEITGIKNPVTTIPGNRMHNNRLYGLCSKYSNGNTNISINNNSIDQNFPSRTRNIKIGHNDLNYKRIIQNIERNNNTKSYIKIEDKSINNKYKGNPDKTHIKYNSMKSEDFYSLKGGKKIKKLNIDNNLLNSVDGSDKFSRVRRGHFNTTSNEVLQINK